MKAEPMVEVYDVTRALREDFRTYLIDRFDHQFDVECIGGTARMTGGRLVVNLIMWMPLITRGFSIDLKKHVFLNGIYSDQVHSDILTNVSRTLEDAGFDRRDLGPDMLDSKMAIHNLNYTHLGMFFSTISIPDIGRSLLQPGMEENCSIRYTSDNIADMEAEFTQKAEDMITLMKSDQFEVNAFRPLLITGAIKEKQFQQFVMAGGPRTDTDEQHIGIPIMGSFLGGMRSISDMAIETLAAAKSNYYNDTKMALTSYQARKVHLMVSTMHRLHQGDCGSQHYLEWVCTPGTVRYFIGCYYLDDRGQLVELTEDRYNDVIGKMVLFRNSALCRHRDGYCTVCGGRITESMSPDGHVGYYANFKVSSPIGQLVLSAKHHTATKAASYKVPKPLEPMLRSVNNMIFMTSDTRRARNKLAIGFAAKDVEQLNDLHYAADMEDIHPGSFSEIKGVSFGVMAESGTVTQKVNRTSISSGGGIHPYLSPEVLEIIRQNPDILIADKNIRWLPLSYLDPHAPIMHCAVVNTSIVRFAASYNSFIQKDIAQCTSVVDAMRKMTARVWPAVGAHITHIGCIVRSAMVTSAADFRIPEIQNPNAVQFGQLLKIIPMRSIATQMAFERYHMVSNSAAFHLTHKDHQIMDEFMSYTDTIERDRAWPVADGTPIKYVSTGVH